MKENNNNIQNLEGIVSKIKEQGINAGKEEQQRIVEEAKKQAAQIIADAEAEKKKRIDQANNEAAQIKKNTQTALQQASRDVVEATKIAVIDHLETIFGQKCDKLFTEKEYLQNLLKVVLESVSGDKAAQVAPEQVAAMEAFLLKESLKDKVELKPLATSDAKIVVTSKGNEGVQFVLSAEDVEKSLFSILNKDLVERITKN